MVNRNQAVKAGVRDKHGIIEALQLAPAVSLPDLLGYLTEKHTECMQAFGVTREEAPLMFHKTRPVQFHAAMQPYAYK